MGWCRRFRLHQQVSLIMPKKKQYVDIETANQYIEWIKNEIELGLRDHWHMPFKSYVEERIGDWGGFEDDEAYEMSIDYILKHLKKHK